MKELYSGNEAIARGAWEAGVHFAAGYPGTPSSEILPALARYEGVQAQWSTNEKVAFDEGVGASIGGLRTLVTMKHVGLNVAADSFMVFPYAGTNAAFVVLSADDPGMHSSQNEQDNRFMARMAKVPLLEPSDPQECRDYVLEAYNLSETYSTPVMLRTTTRTAHTKGLIETGQRAEVPVKDYVPDIQQYSIPIYRRLRRPEVEAKLGKLRQYAETCPLNRVEHTQSSVAFVAAGISYQYGREVLPDAGSFKLGIVHPLPIEALKDFCARYETVFVLEEGEAFIEEQLRAAGITNVVGKEVFGVIGEYSLERVRRGVAQALGQPDPEIPAPFTDLPALPRPPMLCVGCGHRTVFDVLRQLKLHVAGDIGCYTMGALPPYEASHTTFCMGASIGNAFGFRRAGHEKTVAIIGDSTFVHAGIPSLIDTVYNQENTTVIILDNGTTGMTGQQPHPGVGKTLTGTDTHALDFVALARAVGVQFVETVDVWDRKTLSQTIRDAQKFPGPAVVIAQGPCQQTPQMKARHLTPFEIDYNLCTDCGACYRTHCPAIVEGDAKLPTIVAQDCVACAVCVDYCPVDAIKLPDLIQLA